MCLLPCVDSVGCGAAGWCGVRLSENRLHICISQHFHFDLVFGLGAISGHANSTCSPARNTLLSWVFMLIPSLLSVIERKKTPEKGFGNTRLQKSYHRKSDGERYLQLSFTKPDSLRTITWSGQRWLSRKDKLRISEPPSGSEWQESLAVLSRS